LSSPRRKLPAADPKASPSPPPPGGVANVIADILREMLHKRFGSPSWVTSSAAALPPLRPHPRDTLCVAATDLVAKGQFGSHGLPQAVKWLLCLSDEALEKMKSSTPAAKLFTRRAPSAPLSGIANEAKASRCRADSVSRGPAGVVLPAKHESLGVAYVSDAVSLSGVASLRCANSLACFSMGPRRSPLPRRNDNVKVRTAVGVTGWVDGRYLTEPELWQRSAKLLEQAKFCPSRLAAAPRPPPIFALRRAHRAAPHQFGRGAELEILGRAVADWEQVSDERNLPATPKKPEEDWFLVRGAHASSWRRSRAQFRHHHQQRSPAIRPFPSRAGSLPASYPLTYRMLSGRHQLRNVRPWPGLS